MRKLLRLLLITFSGAVLGAPSIVASAPARGAMPGSITVGDSTTTIDINNIRMFVTNSGSFAYDRITGNAGLEYPRGSGKTAVFAAGPWLGAKVGGSLRVAVAEYRDEYGPGAILPGGAPDDPAKPEYHVYKLNRVYPDAASRDAALAAYVAGAVPHGAPSVSVQLDGSLGIRGDQMLWSVFNDADPLRHINQAGSTAPLGVELQQTTYAFHRAGALDNTIFIEYRIINKSLSTMDSTYFSAWADPDLGAASDDLVGCDTTLDVGYVYNSTNSDLAYGATPPAVGFDLLRSPSSGGAPLRMTSFNKYIGGVDPNTAVMTFGLLRGLQLNGSPWIDPASSQASTFPFSGDPVTGSGWLDTNPADRRFMVSSGPFQMAAGDTQTVDIAIVVGQGASRLASLSEMKFADREVQSYFDNGPPPSPPVAPQLTATPADGAVNLSWDSGAETPAGGQYPFQGYNLYQGASPSGPWTRLATYDIVDGITGVLDQFVDPTSGLVTTQVTARGSDSGLAHSATITRDTTRAAPIVNGLRYYFALEAYGVDTTLTPRVALSPLAVAQTDAQPPGGGEPLSRIRVVPNPYFLGSDYEYSSSARVVHFTHLPVRCSIHIYDLAGVEMRVIQKNDNLSQASWDLANEAGHLVASGIYLYVVDAPGIGTSKGKLAIFNR